MARRRYRSDALSSAAKTRPDQPPSTPESYPLGSEPSPASAPAGTSDEKAEAKPDQPAEAISGLKAQIDAMRQPQQPPPQQQVDPLAHYLASIPGLTIPKFQFLYHYFSRSPQNLNPQHWDVLKAAHGIALDRGVQEDSPEYFGFLHSLLNQQAAAAPSSHAAPAPPVHEPPEPEPQHVIDLEAEHSGSSEPEESHAMASFISAPVSRGDHSHAVEPEPTMGSIRLSAEQRDMAARSGISETEYAKQLLKMQKMQKSGLIK
jgi:hypothetical protein